MSCIRSITALLATTALLAGCAHAPDVELGYYLARTQVELKVARTVICDADNNLIIVNSVTPMVTQSADPTQFARIRLAGLQGAFSDSTLAMEFYDDGRLKAINATSTGQGEAILKTVISIAKTVAAAGFVDPAKAAEKRAACAFIRTAGEGKPLTLTYEGEIDLAKPAEVAQAIPADATSGAYDTKLAASIGGVCAFTDGVAPGHAPANYTAASGDAVLTLRQPGQMRLRATAGTLKGCQGAEIWRAVAPVGQSGTTYALPIPAPAAFGKTSFSAAFAESGALTSVNYGAETGAGQVANVVAAAAEATQGQSTSDQVSEINAQSDLIAAQERLAACLADRTNCK
nr:hypothetical protein [Polymorphobacter sp.]